MLSLETNICTFYIDISSWQCSTYPNILYVMYNIDKIHFQVVFVTLWGSTEWEINWIELSAKLILYADDMSNCNCHLFHIQVDPI